MIFTLDFLSIPRLHSYAKFFYWTVMFNNIGSGYLLLYPLHSEAKVDKTTKLVHSPSSFHSLILTNWINKLLYNTAGYSTLRQHAHKVSCWMKHIIHQISFIVKIMRHNNSHSLRFGADCVRYLFIFSSAFFLPLYDYKFGLSWMSVCIQKLYFRCELFLFQLVLTRCRVLFENTYSFNNLTQAITLIERIILPYKMSL